MKKILLLMSDLHIQLLEIGLLRRRTITEEEPWSGRHKDASTDLQVDAVRFMVMNDRVEESSFSTM